MLNTACFLGSRYPLIQAPMAGAQDSAMTVAVCRAGGLGSLPAAMLSVAQLAEQLNQIRTQTDAAFSANTSLPTTTNSHTRQHRCRHKLYQTLPAHTTVPVQAA